MAPSLSGYDLMKLDAGFGEFIGKAIQAWIGTNQLGADLIASHGHTVFHDPASHFTTQIGSGAHIAQRCSIDTITTFRAADVAAGGQGAPFAPVADKILFPGYEGYLNLGGIANIHLQTTEDKWQAWDIGPCNQALNHLATRRGKSYDADGRMAAEGNIDDTIIHFLTNKFPFNNGSPFGLSNAEVKSSWLDYLDAREESPEDLLSSVTEAIARMITDHTHPLVKKPAQILVTGGGAYNKVLIQKLTTRLQRYDISLKIPEDDIIDFKESILMAYLGFLTLKGTGYGVHPVTGAQSDSIGGAYFKAFK